MKSEISKKFNAAAKNYDAYAAVQKKSSSYLAELCNNVIFGGLGSILDIGAGTGQTTEALKEYFMEAEYTLLDIALNMLEKAKEKFTDIKIINADAEKYHFTEKYDLCVSNLSVQWFENFGGFLNKILKHCDYFAFTTLLDSSFDQYNNIFRKRNILPPTFRYFDKRTIDNILKSKNCIARDIKSYNEYFENAVCAAKHFKNIGANISSYAGNNIISAILSHKSEIILEYKVLFVVIKS